MKEQIMNELTKDIKTKNYSFEDLFVKTLKIYFKNLLDLTLPYLIIMIPVLFFTYHYMIHFTEIQMQMAAVLNSDPYAIFKFLGPFLSDWLLMILGSLLLMSLYTPYLIRRVRTIVETDGDSIGQSLRGALAVFPGFLVTYILVGAMTFISFFICCMPVLFISIGLILAAPAATLDRRYFHKAVGDSFSLLSGRYWKTFGYFILLYLVSFTAIMIAIMPFYFLFLGSVIINSFQTAKEIVDPTVAQMALIKQMYHSPFYWIFICGAMLLGGMMRGVLLTAQTLVYINYKNVPAPAKVVEVKPAGPSVQS
jgi:hypothetical protein